VIDVVFIWSPDWYLQPLGSWWGEYRGQKGAGNREVSKNDTQRTAPNPLGRHPLNIWMEIDYD